MGKVFQTLRSMRFGILLLCLIAACSVAGTLIPQDREIAWYAQNYPSLHGTILTLQLNRVFDSWYFKTLLVLLCLNLSLCSLVRIRGVVRAAKSETARAAEMKDAVLLTPEGVEKLRARLEEMRCRREDLIRVLDAMIELQGSFWDSRCRIGETARTALVGCRKRRAYPSGPCPEPRSDHPAGRQTQRGSGAQGQPSLFLWALQALSADLRHRRVRYGDKP